MATRSPVQHQVPAEHLRRLTLAAQGLHQRNPFGRGKAGVNKAIAHLGYVQIDSINVVERAHHQVLWSRVPGYRQDHLHQLLAKDRTVFEYWSHAAAFLPMADYRFSLRRMQQFRSGREHWGLKPNPRMERWILERIRDEGALKARAFSDQRPRGTWWDWSPAKRALERLFHIGGLMVTARDGIEKVYDLPERVLPAGLDTSRPSLDEQVAWLLDTALRSNACFRETEITWLRRDPELRSRVAEHLAMRQGNGDLVCVACPDTGNSRWWLPPASLDLRPHRASRTQVLSPFDSLMLHRPRVQQLFDFDYQIECYLPAAKRQYGYFSLPILRGQRLIGRLDAAAKRAKAELVLNNLHLEPGTRLPPRDQLALAKAVAEFAAFNNCTGLQVARTCANTPAGLPDLFQAALQAAA